MKFQNLNLTYEGLVPRIQKSFPVSGRHASAYPRVRRACGYVHDLPRGTGTRLNEAARSSKIKGINIADACAMQTTSWPSGSGP